MPYRDILIHVDDRSADRIAIAKALADAFGARLTGLHVVPFPLFESYPWADDVPTELIQSHATLVETAAENAQRCFVRTAGSIGCRWRREDGKPGSVLAKEARGFDLVIVGPGSSVDGSVPDIPSLVVMTAGVPVLVVPDDHGAQPSGRRAMVAWNGSREAARAVHDAMPLLKRSKAVDLVEFPAGERSREEAQRDLDMLRQRLTRRGVNVESAETLEDGSDSGAALLAGAVSRPADLIVMGAYGRGRFMDLILGGVTRHMLRHTTIPLLMAH